MQLDEKSNSNTRINEKTAETNEVFGIIRKLACLMPRGSLIAIYTSFFRPCLLLPDLFKYSFFPYTIVEWSKRDIAFRKAKSFLIFRNALLKIVRPIQNSIFKTHDPLLRIKFLTRLKLGLSHRNKHRFRHNFQNCLNQLSNSFRLC